MAATVNQTIQPGFALRISQGSAVAIPLTILDRGGNVINLSGYSLKLSAINMVLQSNGVGQNVPTPIKLFDITLTVPDPTNGNVLLTIPASQTGLIGAFAASLRLWVNAAVNRPPDDAYYGTFLVDPAVVREEA